MDYWGGRIILAPLENYLEGGCPLPPSVPTPMQVIYKNCCWSANSEDPHQIAPEEQSDQGLHCLSRHMSVSIFFIIMACFYSEN